jgi:inorganic pyrophosphatase
MKIFFSLCALALANAAESSAEGSLEMDSSAIGLGLISEFNTFNVVVASLVGCLLALLMAFLNTAIVRSKDDQDEKVEGAVAAKAMKTFAKDIQDGAKDFLITEYKYLSIFVVAFAILLIIIFELQTPGVLAGVRYAGCFVCGAILSASAGWFGMVIATDCNVRTAHAACAGEMSEAKTGLNDALKVAFAGGSVMGFSVVGLGLLGLIVLFPLMTLGLDEANLFETLQLAMTYMTGFGFGASSIALFARVAGGIYTKAADVGADLVGKYENELREDDPKNPAVIADNVGDNVGDVAGMGADLFESYVGSIIAAGSLASNVGEMALPFWIAGAGVIAAAVGSKAVWTKADADQGALLLALKRGTGVAMVLIFGLTALAIYILGVEWHLYGCMVIGLCCGELIGLATEYCTSYEYAPTLSIAEAGATGSATVIIQGLGIGMLSCFPPVILVVVAIVACDTLAGGYGIAVAAVGMLSTLGVTLATDAYGPVADNAGGIAEMAGLPENVREITDKLDALGNTTAATGKGFAIGSAVLTALSLLASFKAQAGLTDNSTDLADPIVLGGILIGAVLPFVFAALTMLSVRKAAEEIILEVRRQFAANPNLIVEGSTDRPDYENCIRISTVSSVKEMVLPGALAILSPITIGFLVGPRCLAGLLTGAIASGFMMAVMMSNAGGAWDNAKKYMNIEKNKEPMDQYKATVVGDTVGDPFKDTSGPALNILIKLMSMVSLVIAPILDVEDWATYQYGFIPLAVMVIVIIACYKLFWSGFDEQVKAKHAEISALKAKQVPATEEKEMEPLVNAAV